MEPTLASSIIFIPAANPDAAFFSDEEAAEILLDEGADGADNFERLPLQHTVAAYFAAQADGQTAVANNFRPAIAEALHKQVARPTPRLVSDAFTDKEKILAKARAILGSKEWEPTVEYLGRYKLLQTIGKGGFATVYLGLDKVTNKQVAIKILQRSTMRFPRRTIRLHQEKNLLMRLRHPNIPRVVDFGDDASVVTDWSGCNRPYLVMEYGGSKTLEHLLLREDSLPWSRAKEILLPLTSALSAVHAAGIVHRDLKPANILLPVLLIDFGIAKDLNDPSQDSDEKDYVTGSAFYLSPEQIRNRGIDPRSDVYGLGILMFEMLTGGHLFIADTLEDVVYAHFHSPPPSLRELCPELNISAGAEAIVLKALAKKPEDRFQSMAEMAAAIEACE